MHAASVAPSYPPAPDPPEHADRAGVEVGVGLLSRWPLEHVETRRLPSAHRFAPVALVARVAHPAGRLPVVVTTTEWEPAYRDDHVAQVQALADILDDAARHADLPVLLLADLNAEQGSPELEPLSHAVDLFSAGGGDPDAVTLSSVVPFAPLEATRQIDRRIDHVLALSESGTGRVEALDAFVVDQPVDGVWPSDHFPVVVDVTLSEAGQR
jgi:endonuclease/exonuclease/phosphatase family metal-dependent hydrolase